MNDIRYGRKRKGIKKELHNKIENWIETITDKTVQDLARKHTICTGGSIASMLLGEKVNDFDIYFTNLATTLAIAEYYVEQFNKDNGYEIEVKQDKDRVRLFIKSAGIAEEDEPLVDTPKPPYRPIFLSENAITLANSVQLITRFYGDPKEIHKNFDFEHAKCWWEHNKQHLELPAKSLECLLSRTLIYTGSLYPIASIFRMKKFIERGWRITAGQQLKIMWQISELNLKDRDVVREQLTGVDMVYMRQLMHALSNVKAEKYESTYVATIIDRIFED